MGIACEYKYKFPVDEWDRIGGLYSLADVPVVRYKDITRLGEIITRDKDQGLYEVVDDQKGWKFVVPFSDVKPLETMPA
jgi:hypothetical protein